MSVPNLSENRFTDVRNIQAVVVRLFMMLRQEGNLRQAKANGRKEGNLWNTRLCVSLLLRPFIY